MLEEAQFHVCSSEEGFYLAPVGEIDMAAGPAFAAAVEGMLSTLGEVVVDMSGVTFMDSAGLNVLCTAAAARSGPPALCSGSGSPHHHDHRTRVDLRDAVDRTGLTHRSSREPSRPSD